MPENTIEHPGEFDALEKARPDELIFTLLERDPCAPPTIAHWCDLRRKRAIEIADEDKRRQELRQITEAELIGLSMLERQKGHQQAAEAPIERPATYSGMTVERTAADEILPKLRAALAEADYHLANAVELLEPRQGNYLASEDLINFVQPRTLAIIRETSLVTHGLALELSPHRAALLAESELPLDGGAA